MLSQSVQAAVSAMDTRDFDFTALVNVILSDFALTQKVIRLANSAMYSAFGGNVTTVSRALMILGIEAVGHLAVGLKLLDHFSSARSNRIDAQLELSRTMLSSHVARHVADRSKKAAREEAVVCTLMRQVGKLLVVFYLEDEWREIQLRSAREERSEEEVCADVLGITFEQLGQEAAARWRLPDAIRTGMRSPTEPASSPPSHHQWLQSVTGYSTAVSEIMANRDLDEDLRQILLGDLARAHSDTLAMTPEQLVELTVSLSEEETANNLLDEIGNLRSNSAAAARPVDPEARLQAGIVELRTLRSNHALKPVQTLASETILAAMGMARVIVFERLAEHQAFEARLGAGSNVNRVLPMLRFPESFAPDVFHLAIANSVGIFIEQAREAKIAAHIPSWFRNALPDAHAFVLLPVRVNTTTVGLVYGDWTHASTVRKITPKEMSALNELAAELGRFFQHASVGARVR
ncbi:HDOD domain-containing protein [Pararobbsia silviterrae]|nr:HDOD domain-containing protein [Pararobbsia silviterrae]